MTSLFNAMKKLVPQGMRRLPEFLSSDRPVSAWSRLRYCMRSPTRRSSIGWRFALTPMSKRLSWDTRLLPPCVKRSGIFLMSFRVFWVGTCLGLGP